MDFIDCIRHRYAANRRIWNIAIVFLLSAIITNHPWLLNWLPESTRADVFSVADQVMRYAIGIVLFFVKDLGVSGNGTAQKPYRKAGKEQA